MSADTLARLQQQHRRRRSYTRRVCPDSDGIVRRTFFPFPSPPRPARSFPPAFPEHGQPAGGILFLSPIQSPVERRTIGIVLYYIFGMRACVRRVYAACDDLAGFYHSMGGTKMAEENAEKDRRRNNNNDDTPKRRAASSCVAKKKFANLYKRIMYSRVQERLKLRTSAAFTGRRYTLSMRRDRRKRENGRIVSPQLTGRERF